MILEVQLWPRAGETSEGGVKRAEGCRWRLWSGSLVAKGGWSLSPSSFSLDEMLMGENCNSLRSPCLERLSHPGKWGVAVRWEPGARTALAGPWFPRSPWPPAEQPGLAILPPFPPSRQDET